MDVAPITSRFDTVSRNPALKKAAELCHCYESDPVCSATQGQACCKNGFSYLYNLLLEGQSNLSNSRRGIICCN